MGCFSCAGKSSKNGSKKKPDDQIPSSSGISMKDAIKLENLDFFSYSQYQVNIFWTDFHAFFFYVKLFELMESCPLHNCVKQSFLGWE